MFDKYLTKHTHQFTKCRVTFQNDRSVDTNCNEINSFPTTSPSRTRKIVKRGFTSSDISESPTGRIKARRIIPSSIPEPSVLDVEPVDNVCNGRKFCIVNVGSHNIDDLKRMVLRHGGKLVENPGTDTFAIVAAKTSRKIQAWIKADQYNIVLTSWLVRALQSERPLDHLLSFSPIDMLHTTAKLQIEFDEDFDCYGNSYYELVDSDGLLQILRNMKTEVGCKCYPIFLHNFNYYFGYRMFQCSTKTPSITWNPS